MNLHASICLMLAVLLTACTSGGDGSNVDSNDSDADTGVNGPLSGTIIIEKTAIDLQTGVRTAFRNASNDYVHTASPDGTRIYAIKDCVNLFDPNCLSIFDPSGRFIGVVTPEEDFISATPRVNKDGLKIILFDSRWAYMKAIRGSDPQNLRFDDLAQRLAVQDATWGPDDNVYYSLDSRIMRAGSSINSSVDDDEIYRFDRTEGVPGKLAVSPDGSTIAVELISSLTGTSIAGSVWLINTDGSGARRFITSDVRNGARWPVWSPDGAYLIVSVNPGGDLVGTGLIRKGVVAFDVNYDLHETTLTGDLAADGRIVLQARNAVQTTSETPPMRPIESFEVSSWSFNSLEYLREGSYPLPSFP